MTAQGNCIAIRFSFGDEPIAYIDPRASDGRKDESGLFFLVDFAFDGLACFLARACGWHGIAGVGGNRLYCTLAVTVAVALCAI
jgi:hypothetical protein